MSKVLSAVQNDALLPDSQLFIMSTGKEGRVDLQKRSTSPPNVEEDIFQSVI